MRLPPTPPAPPMIDLARTFAADRYLQQEIDKGIESLASGPPQGVIVRVVRILETVLDPCWEEHMAFQEEALFPLITKSAETTLEMRALLNGLRREHAEIDARQRDFLANISQRAADDRTASPLGPDFEDLITLRRGHRETEAALTPYIPAVLDDRERAALDRWLASRGKPPFPLSLILTFWDS